MLKRLQNLLFEDEELEDEEEYEEEEEEEIEEVKPAKKKRGRKKRHEEEDEEEVIVNEPVHQPVFQSAPSPAPVPEPAPAVKPVLKRVEVTQAISVNKPAPVQPEPSVQQTARPAAPAFNNQNFQRPAAPVQHAQPRPIFENTRPAEPTPAFKPAPSGSSFNISADDNSARRPQAQSARPVNNTQAKRQPAKKQNPDVYEFRPVISPMFGVDEKDMQAVAYVAKNEPAEADPNSLKRQVISPMSGMVEQQASAQARMETQDIPSFDGSAYQPQIQPDDSPYPEFSLDDILSARDEEFTRQNVFSNNQEYRTPDIDETAVIDSNHYSPFDQQALDFDRNR